MKIIGIGTDIVETDRVAAFFKDKRALNRVFTEGEQEYCFSKKNKYQHLAVRFSAKEAVIKALPFDGVALKKIEVFSHANGAPYIKVDDPRAKKLDIKISLSHSKKYAVATALITQGKK